MTALIITYFVQRQSFYRQPCDHSATANSLFSLNFILNQNALKDQEEIVLHIEKICENQGAAEKKGTALNDDRL